MPRSIFRQPGYSVKRHSNPVSSVDDDTIYSRENTESMIQLYCSSEIESMAHETDSEDEATSLDVRATKPTISKIEHGPVKRDPEEMPLIKDKMKPATAHKETTTFIGGNSQESCDQSCDHQLEDRNGSKEQLVYF